LTTFVAGLFYRRTHTGRINGLVGVDRDPARADDHGDVSDAADLFAFP
jgi:hypothetical protein